jgi:hypothetical protein
VISYSRSFSTAMHELEELPDGAVLGIELIFGVEFPAGSWSVSQAISGILVFSPKPASRDRPH